jgi:hypothetical protein
MLRRLWPRRRRSSPAAPIVANEVKVGFAQALLAREMTAAHRILDAAIPGASVRVELDSASAPAAAVLRWTLADGRSTLAFHETAYDIVPELIFSRLADFLPIVIETMRTAGAQGACYFNMGDEGHMPGLASCANHAGFTLVPDCIFLAHHGYSGLAGHFASKPVPYAARAPVAFWRGASTGVRTADVMELPRVRLCTLGLQMGPKADIGLNRLVGVDDEEAKAVAAANLIRPEVRLDHLDRYRVHIDIDGNSNSWPGLLTKLHSGSPVMKVQSPWGFRQWYYDRLKPWENYVPVRSDMSDLEEKLDYLLAHPAQAEAIGEQGRALARSLSYDSQVAWAAPVAAAALAREAL